MYIEAMHTDLQMFRLYLNVTPTDKYQAGQGSNIPNPPPYVNNSNKCFL